MTSNVSRMAIVHDEHGKPIVGLSEGMNSVYQLRSRNIQTLNWKNNDTTAGVNCDHFPVRDSLDIELPERGSNFFNLELMPGKVSSNFLNDTVDYIF